MQRGRGRASDQKVSNVKGSIKRLIRYLRGYFPVLIIVAILTILGTASTVVGPLISGQIINGIRQGFELVENTPGVPIDTKSLEITLFTFWKVSFLDSIIILAIFYFLASAISYSAQLLASIVTLKINYRMRNDLAKKFSKLPLKFFDNYTRGELLSRVTNDAGTLAESLGNIVTEVFRGFFMIVFVTVMMFLLSWELSLVVYTSIILSLLSSMYLVSKSRKYFRQSSKDIGRVNSHVEESYSGHLIVSAFNYQEKGMEEFVRINEILKQNSFKSQFISGIMWPIQILFSNLSFILIALVGGYLTLAGRFQVGFIQTFVTYSRQINQPIMTLGSMANTLQMTAASSERVFELLDAEEEKEENFGEVLTDVKGNVSFSNIFFSYVEGTEVIKDFSASIKSGQMVAIVGPTGAGKTTIVNLLMRFYDINSGEIKIDGHNIYEVNREDVRKQFAMVLQDTWIFEGTIFENISYGTPNATLEEVQKAAKEAQIDRFIETQPGGYDFMLHEDGENISQGQRQLITIARAILANRPMIILDEATSSVDTRTEQLIQDAMDRLTTSRTSFVIAHRLSTIRNADLILVLKDGNVVEQGNHDELLTRDGHYAELYYSQFDNGEVI